MKSGEECSSEHPTSVILQWDFSSTPHLLAGGFNLICPRSVNIVHQKDFKKNNAGAKIKFLQGVNPCEQWQQNRGCLI